MTPRQGQAEHTDQIGRAETDAPRRGRTRHGRAADTSATTAGGPRHGVPHGGRHGDGPGRFPYQERFGSPDGPSPADGPDTDPPKRFGAAVEDEDDALDGPETDPPRRRWPWILAGGLVVLLVGIGLGRASVETAPVAAAPTATVAAPAPPVAPPSPAPSSRVTLPAVSGQNGAIVADQLGKLGLTKVQYASRDDADTVVVNPANWTAVKIEPRPGTKIAADTAVVVTMSKKN
jgi:hypothetical protein